MSVDITFGMVEYHNERENENSDECSYKDGANILHVRWPRHIVYIILEKNLSIYLIHRRCKLSCCSKRDIEDQSYLCNTAWWEVWMLNNSKVQTWGYFTLYPHMCKIKKLGSESSLFFLDIEYDCHTSIRLMTSLVIFRIVFCILSLWYVLHPKIVREWFVDQWRKDLQAFHNFYFIHSRRDRQSNHHLMFLSFSCFIRNATQHR